MKKWNKTLIPAFAVVILVGIGLFMYNNQEVGASSPFGLLEQSRLAQGRDMYAKNCAACHGNDAVGGVTPVQLNGKEYQAPPLNGKAHTWHHPPSQLFSYIQNGSPDKKSPMVGFQGRLKDEEIQTILAYLYNTWPERVQKRYARFQ